MDKPIRILAPHSFREQLSRRAFLRAGTATAGLAIVAAACGNSGSVGGDTTAPASSGGGDWSELEGKATGEWSRKIAMASGALAMYTWGDYNDPALVGALAESTLGVTMRSTTTRATRTSSPSSPPRTARAGSTSWSPPARTCPR